MTPTLSNTYTTTLLVPFVNKLPGITAVISPWSIFILIASTSLMNTLKVPLPILGELKNKFKSKFSSLPTITVSGNSVEI